MSYLINKLMKRINGTKERFNNDGITEWLND